MILKISVVSFCVELPNIEGCMPILNGECTLQLIIYKQVYRTFILILREVTKIVARDVIPQHIC